MHQTSLDQVQPFLQERIGDWAWDSVAARILEQPAWLVLGVIGILLILLGRRKKKLIGYTRE